MGNIDFLSVDWIDKRYIESIDIALSTKSICVESKIPQFEINHYSADIRSWIYKNNGRIYL